MTEDYKMILIEEELFKQVLSILEVSDLKDKKTTVTEKNQNEKVLKNIIEKYINKFCLENSIEIETVINKLVSMIQLELKSEDVRKNHSEQYELLKKFLHRIQKEKKSFNDNDGER